MGHLRCRGDCGFVDFRATAAEVAGLNLLSASRARNLVYEGQEAMFEFTHVLVKCGLVDGFSVLPTYDAKNQDAVRACGYFYVGALACSGSEIRVRDWHFICDASQLVEVIFVHREQVRHEFELGDCDELIVFYNDDVGNIAATVFDDDLRLTEDISFSEQPSQFTVHQ